MGKKSESEEFGKVILDVGGGATLAGTFMSSHVGN